MSDLYTWATTAADNNSQPPDGWPEGQLPNTVNNCGREMMRAIKAGVVIWWPSVTAMRAITTNPGTDSRHVLLDTTAGVKARYYQWKDTKTAADNGNTIVSPTGTLSTGAFEELGAVQSVTDITDTSLTTVLNVAGLNLIHISASATLTITSLTGAYTGQELFIVSTGSSNKLFWGFDDSGGNVKGNAASQWRCTQKDYFWVKYDGTNYNFFCGQADAADASSVISLNSARAYAYHGNGAASLLRSFSTSISLESILGCAVGDMVRLSLQSLTGHTIIAVDGVGNMQLAGNFTMSVGDSLTLMKSDTNTWLEVSRSKNV